MSWAQRLLIVTGLACALCAGCATDQRADVAAYRRESDPPGELPTHGAGDALSLVKAMQLTAARNEQLAAQGERYVQALADRERLAANLMPTIDLFGELALRENARNGGVLQSNGGIGAQYELLTGMGDFRSIEAAEFAASAEKWMILDLREALLLETARAYYEALRAERLAGVLASSVEAQMVRLDEARARNEVGFARPLDVSQIEAQASRTRAQLISAQGQARESRAVLGLLTNAEVRDSALDDGFEVPSQFASIEELLAIAARHRQDVIAARDDAAAARLQVDAAISQFAPSIGINLDYFLFQSPDDSAASIASLVAVRVPIFSAGRIEAEVRASWSVFRERVLAYRLRVREVRSDVESAESRLRSSLARVDELRTQVAVARETLALAEAAYEAGLGTNLERVTAQDDLLNAELQAVSEEFIAKAAYLSLRRACGLLSAELIGSPLPEAGDTDADVPTSPILDREPESAPVADPIGVGPGAEVAS